LRLIIKKLIQNKELRYKRINNKKINYYNINQIIKIKDFQHKVIKKNINKH